MKPCPRKKTTQAIQIDDQYCKGCFLCLEVCPKEVLRRGSQRSRAGYAMPQVERLQECISCLLCELTCPDLTLTVVMEET